jgi:hypothetical protein
VKRAVAIIVVCLIFFLAFYKRQRTPYPRPVAPWPPVTQARPSNVSLTEARRNFKTVLLRHETEHVPVDTPPAKLFRTVQYDSPIGKLAAYISQPANDGQRHPAIVWIIGGFSNSIGDTAWVPQPADNDQSASAFWKAGIITMYPSFRGGNQNPGYKESFYGEVDDLLAAVDYLAKQDFVDPKRIYLGGHSTGGTMALLAAESSDRFRAVFSFGPIDDIGHYGQENLVCNTDDKELDLRSPKLWMNSIHDPTFVFEGTRGNIESLLEMKRTSSNPLIQFYTLFGYTHFTDLAPMTRLLAAKILADTGPNAAITITQQELENLGK